MYFMYPMKFSNRTLLELSFYTKYFLYKSSFLILEFTIISLSSKRTLFEAISSVDNLPYEQGVPKKGALKRGKRRRGFFAFGGNFQRSTSGLPGVSVMGGVKAFHFDKLSVRGIAVSDLDKDGKNELVVLTSTQLIAFQIINNKLMKHQMQKCARAL